MADISNEKAISVMKKLQKGYLDLIDNRRIYKECFIVLDSIEAAIRALGDERTEGSWELHGMIYYCSECGHECGESGDNFCGNCGSKMKLYGSEV